MKHLTDKFQLCLSLCIGNTKLLYLFLHWQHNWHPNRRQLASCCICCLVFAFRWQAKFLTSHRVIFYI